MKGRHVGKEAGVHEVIGISTRFHAMSDRAIEEARDGGHGLEKGRHAEVIE
jgi:hypothetical protein